jgi:predicted lipoprotein with Yx(FWY)xxD motif
MAGLAGIAEAQSPTTLTIAKNAMLGEHIVVDAHGLTVYELRPETTRHLLCRKATGCFTVWRPLTVASATTKLTAARGITPKLGTLHRDGIFQVTLGGHPLYHYVGDGSKRGAATGQDIRSFGGTWHVVATSPVSTAPVTPPATPTGPTTPTTTTPTTPYYPGYPLGL